VDEILLDQEAGETIRLAGKCYFRLGVVLEAPTHALADLDGCYPDCDTCDANLSFNQLIDENFVPVGDHEGNYISFP
jgi:hypothetical protein